VIIIDCSVGNLFSIRHALKKTCLDAFISSSLETLKDADAIVLPGVGNFKMAAQGIRLLTSSILELAEEGVPLLGICLGMQLLFEKSEDSFGSGLRLLHGRVSRLPAYVKTPHMGWNTLRISRQNELLEGIEEGDYFYFVHSYYADPSDKEIIVAETDYGVSFASVVAYRNVYGTQFHPEKSGKPGARMLQNFARIVKR
jgi:glutamine amidotransferase